MIYYYMITPMLKKKQLRIAIIIDDFYPSSGGVARSVQTQIGELTREGHSVTLIAPAVFLDRPSNCKAVAVPALHIPKTPSHMCSLRSSMKIARAISKLYNFDIIHSQTERGGLILAARIAKIQNIPHIHTFHANLSGTHIEQPLLSVLGSAFYLCIINPLFARVSKRRTSSVSTIPNPSSSASNILARLDWYSLAAIAQRVDAFTAPASFMIHCINSCNPSLQGHGHIIPTGVNRSLLSALTTTKPKQDKSLRFLSVGRLSKEKRVDTIIQAFIRADIRNSSLDIVGSGDQEKYLQKIANKRPNITFHKHINKIEELAGLYAASDIFVIASYQFDTQAIVIAEAVTAGLPIVYCDNRLTVGVSADNGFFSESPDANALAEAMQNAANQHSLEKAKQASKKIAPRLLPDSMAQAYISLYRSVIASRPPGSLGRPKDH